MRASTSQGNLNLRSDLLALLQNRKKEQEYGINKTYKQFESTYNKDFRESSQSKQIESLKALDNNGLNTNTNKSRSLLQSQSLLDLKNERGHLLQQYLQAKKRSTHRNIQSFQGSRDNLKGQKQLLLRNNAKDKQQFQTINGGAAPKIKSQSVIQKQSEEQQSKVIEEYFSKTVAQTPVMRKSESQNDFQSQIMNKQLRTQTPQAQLKQNSTLSHGNRSQSQVSLLKETFPKKHKYLLDHIEHMQDCPQLVCICCSTKTGDHFVPFKYPHQMGTQYEKIFTKEVNDQGHRAPMFILDNEKQFGTKVQSGQQYVTTQRNDYKLFQVKPVFGGVKKYNDHALYDEEGNKKERLDFHQNSSYRTNFRGLHIDGVYHEKNPVYPVYSMPFKDKSSYQKTFNALQIPVDENREYDRTLVADLRKRAKEGRVLCQDMPFQSTTTNRVNFSATKPYDKAVLCPPPVDTVKTFTKPELTFMSMKQQDYVAKLKPKCEINQLKHQMMNGTATCKHSFKQLIGL
eukprot:403339867